jgi:hypothetical protein
VITDTTHPIENRLVHVRVPARLREELKRLAQDEAESEASIVRRALRRELAARLVETR